MITLKQIKDLVSATGAFIQDARLSSYRLSHGFTVTQQKDVPQKYIIIKKWSPKGEGANEVDAIKNALDAEGIKYGFHLGMFYIHPLQLDDN